MRIVRLVGSAVTAIVLLGVFFRLEGLHARILLAVWPQYPDALPFQGGSMWQMGVRTVQLGTEGAIELLYKMFNPGEEGKPMSINSQ